MPKLAEQKRCLNCEVLLPEEWAIGTCPSCELRDALQAEKRPTLPRYFGVRAGRRIDDRRLPVPQKGKTSLGFALAGTSFQSLI
jgi:hypothetical protein